MFQIEINNATFHFTLLGVYSMTIYALKVTLQFLYSSAALLLMALGLIQEPSGSSSTVERLIDRFGLPVAMLVVVGLFLWKGLWPFIIKRIEANEEMLKEQIEAAHTELKSARDYSVEIINKQNAILTSLAQSVDFIKQELMELRKTK